VKQKFQTYDNYIKMSISKQTALLNSDACFSNVFSLSWNHKAKRKEYTFASSLQFYSIRSAVESFCATHDTSGGGIRLAKDQQSEADTCIRSKFDRTVAIQDTLLRSDKFSSKQWDIFYSKNKDFLNISQTCSRGCKKIVVYQRDLSRKIEHLDAVSKRIQGKINFWNSISKRRSSNTSNSSRCGCWAPLEVVTHSNDRPVCELFHQLSQASVLITAHGFQSSLLLFQPLHSTLIEIHPWLAFKPKVYGAMQYGIRDVARIPR
jgi:hypothetical protein